MRKLFICIFLIILASCSYKSVNTAKQFEEFEGTNRGILVYTFTKKKDGIQNGFSYFYLKNITNGKVKTLELNGNINTKDKLLYENADESRYIVNMTLDPGEYIFYAYSSYLEKGRGLTYQNLTIPVGTINEKEITYIGNFSPEKVVSQRHKKKKRKFYKAVIFSRTDEFEKDSLHILSSNPNLSKYPIHKSVIEGITLN
ncbi:MAG: hypothetical protein GX159_11555 [Flavobacteriaceae bacterium]|jgi:hypothetical protein|nr:hypothetical protein [Flavobacteriaceae bacterium]